MLSFLCNVFKIKKQNQHKEDIKCLARQEHMFSYSPWFWKNLILELKTPWYCACYIFESGKTNSISFALALSFPVIQFAFIQIYPIWVIVFVTKIQCWDQKDFYHFLIQPVVKFHIFISVSNSFTGWRLATYVNMLVNILHWLS